MTLQKTILSFAILLLAAIPPALAQGTYTQIDYPGALETYIQAVDDAGDTVGSYVDTNDIFHGFLYSGGTFTVIDYSPGVNTYLTGINDSGQIVGVTLSSPYTAFLYDLNSQMFTTISDPHATRTLPFAINSEGLIAGYFYGLNGVGTAGFESIGPAYKTVAPPNSPPRVYVYGVSSSGTILGNVTSEKFNVIFLFRNGKYSKMPIPGTQDAIAYGIAPNGSLVVGTQSLPLNTVAGFTYDGQTLTTIQFPGSEVTTLGNSINDGGEVAGTFDDSTGRAHGFTWTPSTPTEKK